VADTLTPVLTDNWDQERSWTLSAYEERGGYAALKKALDMAPDAVVEEVKDSGLRGRGGAGFPTGMKWGFIPQDNPRPKYLVVNADESEPGTCKDIPLMMASPHTLIEGVIISSYAIRANHAFIYVRGEVLHVVRRLQRAVQEAYLAGHLGKDIHGSGYDLDLVIHAGAGAYICGEETALLDSLEGRRGQPRPRPPFPPVQGLYMAPTQINNVCTIATVPAIIELGAERFAQIGTPGSPGTVVFSVSGNVEKPGNYELELGTSMRELIYTHAGGIAGGHQLKAVIPGGSSVPALTARQIDVPLDYDSLGAIGTFFGAASLIVVDERCCMVQLALRSTKFYMHESCGKCTPCREGTRWMVQILEKLERGDGELSDIELLKSVGSRILGKSLCALGDFAVYPVASYLEKWGEEFVAHVEQGGCPYGGDSSLEGILAPSDQHTHSPVAEVPA
jgi:NADH-quinone oxidoreductase subunit F